MERSASSQESDDATLKIEIPCWTWRGPGIASLGRCPVALDFMGGSQWAAAWEASFCRARRLGNVNPEL